jgi:hypothetical protein
MINEIALGTDIVNDKMKSKTLSSMEVCLSDKRLKAVIAWHNEEWRRLEKEKMGIK